MKSKKRINSKKIFNETRKRFAELRKGLAGIREEITGFRQGFSGIRKRFAELRRTLTDTGRLFAELRKEVTETRKTFPDVRQSAGIFLFSAAHIPDYIPEPDAEFDEWQKNFVSHLSALWPPAEPGTSALYVYLGIPAERCNEVIAAQRLWEKDFARGGKETDRRKSETAAKQETRDVYEPLLRSVVNEYIRFNRKASKEIKTMLGLTVPDLKRTHRTAAIEEVPDFVMLPIGGGEIKFAVDAIHKSKRAGRFRHADIEVRYKIISAGREDIPKSADELPNQYISTKAVFLQNCGANTLEKVLYAAIRWVDLTNTALNGPWSNVQHAIIA